MSRFSICIPAHDRGENGPKWMRELFDSIKKQTLQDFDIVVVDESENDLILDTCKEYSDDFEFTYIKCSHLKDDGITDKSKEFNLEIATYVKLFKKFNIGRFVV